MYLVGIFNRDYSVFSENKNPLSLVGLVEEITKANLQRASTEDDYQVIDLIQRKYFDPKQNAWIALQKF